MRFLGFNKYVFLFCFCWLWCTSAIALFDLPLLSKPVPPIRFELSGITNKEANDNAHKRLMLTADSMGKDLSKLQAAALYQQASKIIMSALEPYGYFKSVVTPISLIAQNGRWFAKFSIIPGPVQLITGLHIQIIGSGQKEVFFDKALLNLPLKVGSPLTMTAYNAAQQKLFNIAQAHGYMDAKFTVHRILVNLEHNTAVIELTFATGPQYFFGPLTFSKNPLSANFLTKFSPFKQGEPYDTDQLLKLQNNLSSSVYFSQVDVEPNLPAAITPHYQVPIHVKLIPNKANLFQTGIGYGTDTGARGLLGWNRRIVNSSGNHFQALLQASQVINTLSANYVIPGRSPLTEQYNLLASIQSNHLPQGDSFTNLLSAGYTRTKNRWQQNYALRLENERFRENNNAASKITTILTPMVSWTKLKTNDPLRPTHGYRLNFKINGGSTYLFSDTDFLRLETNDRVMLAPSKNNRLLLSTNIGYITASNLTDKLPISERFYAGGTQSIRGYSFQALGPGRYLFVATSEYRYQVIKHWFTALFFDTGNAFNSFHNLTFVRSTGVGVVWQTPVGTAELTYARVISQPGFPSRVQFSMGTDL